MVWGAVISCPYQGTLLSDTSSFSSISRRTSCISGADGSAIISRSRSLTARR